MGIEIEEDLSKLIKVPSKLDKKQTYKCRILYDTQIHQVEFVPYAFRQIQSLQLIHNDALDYSHKYADRRDLHLSLQKKGKADGIIIVKNGLITDSSYANLAFFDGLQWFTPSTPLLAGTKRAYLLQQNILKETNIRPSDLKHFETVRLVNSMMDWEKTIEVPIKNIHF